MFHFKAVWIDEDRWISCNIRIYLLNQKSQVSIRNYWIWDLKKCHWKNNAEFSHCRFPENAGNEKDQGVFVVIMLNLIRHCGAKRSSKFKCSEILAILTGWVKLFLLTKMSGLKNVWLEKWEVLKREKKVWQSLTGVRSVMVDSFAFKDIRCFAKCGAKPTHPTSPTRLQRFITNHRKGRTLPEPD